MPRETTIRGEIEAKRFYLPGFTLSRECTDCGEQIEWDGDHQYISNPELEVRETIDLYCDCGQEVQVDIVLHLSVEVMDA